MLKNLMNQPNVLNCTSLLADNDSWLDPVVLIVSPSPHLQEQSRSPIELFSFVVEARFANIPGSLFKGSNMGLTGRIERRHFGRPGRAG